MRKWSAVTVVGLLALGLVACGGLDTDKLEDEVSADAQAELDSAEVDASVESVSCPDDVASETGETFECQVEFSDDTSATAEGEVTDGDSGDVEYTFTPN